MAVTKKAKSTVNTTTGINEAGIPKMISSISAYKDTIKKKVELTTSDKKIEAAIKGTSTEAAFKTMLVNIEQQMESLLDNLDGLSNALQANVKTSYVENDKNNQSFADVSAGLSE